MQVPLPLSAFTLKTKGRSNVLVSEIRVSEAFDLRTAGIPPRPTKPFKAIWDTGATNTVITQRVIDDCGLKPISMTKVNTASGQSTTEIYLVSIGLPNKVGISELRVTRGVVAGDAEVLIGMDIIGAGDFAVTNKDGHTAFSFRVPSCECIDFVEQAKIPAQKVNRNAPCPCGSGKKYKKCCGK